MKPIAYTIAMIVVGLMTLLLPSQRLGSALVKMQRLCERGLADGRTVAAAFRYLTAPDVPDLKRPLVELASAKTNLPEPFAEVADPVLASVTNLTRLTISNGVAATQNDRTVPG